MKTITFIVVLTPLLAATAYLQSAIHFNENDGLQKVEQLKQEIAKQAAKNQAITEENERHSAVLRELEEQPEYHTEMLARKWLYMVKPDEVYVAE